MQCEGEIEKSIPRITDWHPEAWRVMTNRDHVQRRIFLSHLTRIIESFSCSPLNTSFYIGKTWKILLENPEYAEMWHGDVILTLQ